MWDEEYDEDDAQSALFAGMEDEEEKEKNRYIQNPDEAVGLIAAIVKRENYQPAFDVVGEIGRDIGRLFRLFSDVSLPNELVYYNQFCHLYSRLKEHQKIKKIHDKTILGFGGQYSAGKSKFINSIAKIHDQLPVDLKPTTSIPTYIIGSEQNQISANSVHGYSIPLTEEAMKAITHDFYDTYKIGFTAFLDSIIVESSEYQLSKEIALLDTPGYTKFDGQKDARTVMTDQRKAVEQLRLADYMIWLVDISMCSELMQSDIDFLTELNFETPILVVFNKADLVSEDTVRQAVEKAKTTLDCAAIPYYAVTAYSAEEEKEYGDPQLSCFLHDIAEGGARKNDLVKQFRELQSKMRAEIDVQSREKHDYARKVFTQICAANRIMEMRSLAELWGELNQQGYKVYNLLKEYDKLVERMNREIKDYMGMD